MSLLSLYFKTSLMFDTSLKIRLAQIQKNKNNSESFVKQRIYVFQCKDKLGCIKYIATVKEYENNLLTIEFYPKVYAIEKYKILTFQYRFPSIGATILEIMRSVQDEIGISCFGILSASLVDEMDNNANKRYSAYVNILTRKIRKELYKVLGVQENSFIFVLPVTRLDYKEKIILRYEEMFKETQ